MISLEYAGQKAETLLNVIKERLNEFADSAEKGDNTLTVTHFRNGRENGFIVSGVKRSVAFAEFRKSDDYFGPSRELFGGNISGKETEAKLYKPFEYHYAIHAILSWIIEGNMDIMGFGSPIHFN